MEDNIKQLSSYQQDQEILDARGIEMTVAEVAGLPTCKYAARLRQLRLSDEDRALIKAMRRRIKNRMASQNSRRRSMEHLRRLTRELRVVRACRHDALAERRVLIAARDRARVACDTLRTHLCQTLQERGDPTEVPPIDVKTTESLSPIDIDKTAKTPETETPTLPDCFKDNKIERDKSIFECRLDKLVQQSVNHMYKGEKSDKRKIFAKTVFINNDSHSSEVKSMVIKTEFHDGDEIEDFKKELDSEIEEKDNVKKELWNNVKVEDLRNVKKEDLNIKLKANDVVKTTLKIPDVSNRKIQDIFKRNGSKSLKIQNIFNDKAKDGVDSMNISNIANGGLKAHELKNHTIMNGSKTNNFSKKIENIFKSNGKIRDVTIEDVLKRNVKTMDVSIEDILKRNVKTQDLSIEDVFKSNVKSQNVNYGDVLNSNEKVQGVSNGVQDLDKVRDESGVLNLCVKRRSHGRKQSAPRRIAYACVDEDVVLDLKIKKEPQ